MTTPDPTWEPAMAFDGVTLSPRKEVVRKFYKDMWDHADLSLIPDIFHEGFTFRGSLGPTMVGHRQFADYVRWVTDTFGTYTSDILAMVEDGESASAKLRFHGIHRKELFGISATGRHVWWYGAPFFTFDGDKVKDLWVLGDIHGLIDRLKDGASNVAEFKTSV
ncbi:ester cyclase [Neorhizobium galegae]|uniref:Putative ester cyclase n=1 Tax=Neorhizobium galegae bv. orientalis str. HAMBI 540 TaxID=1028800 RepID=A0A068T247_NEOGA|nr:ester cyclase [Neorhizobium galegae]MCQ1854458.1 ester cyclase [Neorhizobium galegae]CDN51570.1 Putative ester cyclase [Neorhizobium galegae bv. orientalis str. HAMBI 540]CDZ54656.1 Putative ester cyclase [Neorhizobium galegae bv. orientalis]